MAIESIYPANGELIQRFDEDSAEKIDAALNRAQKAFRHWRETSFEYRADLIRKMSALLQKERRRLGEMITREMGKPITQSIMEIDKCAAGCDFYAENAEKYLAPRIVATDADDSYVRYDPIGPVLAVMPWNFPFWQVYRFAAPTLMGGNVAVLKHASNVPLCALEIEKLFLEAGFPEGVFSTLLISAQAAEGVIKDRRIAAVTLTGSEAAGRKVAAAAGSALKKCVLELGGSDPFIVLPDANLEMAAAVGAISRSINSGQTCISAKRFIVHKDVAEQFSQLLKARLAEKVVGDPMDERTEIGPMARPDLRSDLHDQVLRSVKQGASVELGGVIPEGPGYFYPTTLLCNVGFHITAAVEETFGPVTPIITVDSADQALELANSSAYGLGGSIWTKDLDRAHDLVRRLEVGAAFVNGLVKSDPRLPFGGIKNSGYGRELAEEGIREFMNVKTVWMAK